MNIRRFDPESHRGDYTAYVGMEEAEEGEYILHDDVLPLLSRIEKLEAQLKHNSDRDYNRGHEDGLRAGLNGG